MWLLFFLLALKPPVFFFFSLFSFNLLFIIYNIILLFIIIIIIIIILDFYFGHFCLLLWYDSLELTGSRLGETEGQNQERSSRIQTQDAHSTTALCLPTGLSAPPNKLFLNWLFILNLQKLRIVKFFFHVR